MKKTTKMFSSSLLRTAQTILFWTLIRHVKEQQAYIDANPHRGHVGQGAISTHKIGSDWEYALCGAAVYSVGNTGEVTCHFCQVLTP